MISQATQDQMDALEARLTSYGVEVLSMRLYSYNAVIGAILQLADGSTIELEYHRNHHCEFFINGKAYCGLKHALECAGIIAAEVEDEDAEVTTEEVAAPIIHTGVTAMIITNAQALETIDPCDYYYQGNQITWYGYKAGVLDIKTAGGFHSLELPCTLDTQPEVVTPTLRSGNPKPILRTKVVPRSGLNISDVGTTSLTKTTRGVGNTHVVMDNLSVVDGNTWHTQKARRHTKLYVGTQQECEAWKEAYIQEMLA